ncbi:MAG: hypothetical protein QXU98_14425 [Candidatus Parvarchaeota archaeon]
MTLSEEEKQKRKLEYLFTEISNTTKIENTQVKQYYEDYLRIIRDLGVDFVDNNFKKYCIDRKNSKSQEKVDKQTRKELLEG